MFLETRHFHARIHVEDFNWTVVWEVLAGWQSQECTPKHFPNDLKFRSPYEMIQWLISDLKFWYPNLRVLHFRVEFRIIVHL